MSTNRLYQYILTLFFCWLPFGSFAGSNICTSATISADFHQDRDKKQDRGKENKKPEVKEVPQSRRQEKPGEVKSGKKEKPVQENKKRNH